MRSKIRGTLRDFLHKRIPPRNILKNPKQYETKAEKLKKMIEKTDFWNNASNILIDEIKN